MKTMKIMKTVKLKKANPIKILSVIILCSLIFSAGFFGVIDFITPGRIMTFNIDDLNRNGIIVYSDGDYSMLDFFPLLFNRNRDGAQAVFSDASLQMLQATASPEITAGNNFFTRSYFTAKLFGVIPIRTVEVTVFPETSLIPGGMPFGVKFFTEGVIVVGVSDIETEKGSVNPAKAAGIKTSDIITEINGSVVNSVEEAARIIEASGGAAIELKIQRDSKTLDLKLRPVYSVSEEKYKSGIWLRDSTAGIGTVTFVSPANFAFGGLGHGICDIDTGNLMPLKRGTVVSASIENVIKGRSDMPGELKGRFRDNIGTLLANTHNGIFGILSNSPVSIEDVTPVPIGLRQDVREGKAVIYSTVDERGQREFEIEIIKIYKNSSDSKNFLIRITDPELLEITGGIVQGMSGSPIIQNGKLIGAVTHVLVSDPAKGYGIFIDNMLTAMPETLR